MDDEKYCKLAQNFDKRKLWLENVFNPSPWSVHFLVVGAQAIGIPALEIAYGAIILSLDLLSLCVFAGHDWSLKILSLRV